MPMTTWYPWQWWQSCWQSPSYTDNERLFSLLIWVNCCHWLHCRASAAKLNDHRRRQRDCHERCIDEVRDAVNGDARKQHKQHAAEVCNGTHHTGQLTTDTHRHTDTQRDTDTPTDQQDYIPLLIDTHIHNHRGLLLPSLNNGHL